MSKIFDRILTIVLIALVIALISKLIMEIKIMTELEYPADCITINDDYYCKVHNEAEKKDIFVM